jgi:3-isopropylmalate/(R)-2-methylmalate dehydratase small subunit
VSVKGRVRKFGDNIDTDGITPAASLHLDIEELKLHAFEPINPEFHRTVQPDDIIVAGNNFGCGSSREQATEVVKVLGIEYVLCESMARIYLRNCIGLGLYPIICPGISRMFEEGDEIDIDTDKGELKNPKTGEVLTFKPLSGTAEKIRKAGGILAHLRQMTER